MEQTQLILFFFISTIILIIIVGSIIAFLFQYRKRKIQHETEKQTLALQYQNEINQAQLEMKDNTLKQVGMDLHDNIGQLLTVSKIHSQSLLKAYPDDKKLLQLDEVLLNTINEVKALSKSLDHSRITHFGFHHELQNEIERLQKLNLCTIQYTIDENSLLHNNEAIIVFRIIQEFLSNSIKYSQCTLLKIAITQQSSALHFLLQDNGKGFSMQQYSNSSGLLNIKNRLDIVQAQNILFESNTNGTTLQFEIETT